MAGWLVICRGLTKYFYHLKGKYIVITCVKYKFRPFSTYFLVVETNIYNTTTRKFTVATMLSLLMTCMFNSRCKPIVISERESNWLDRWTELRLKRDLVRPLTVVFYFCFQERCGSLFINNESVHDLGVKRNITGFVPQVSFASEIREQLLSFFYRCPTSTILTFSSPCSHQ